MRFDPNQNHGRMGADDYTGCPVVEVPHETLSPGSCCPACEAEGHLRKLSVLAPRKIVILEGRPIISGTRFHCARFRCDVCGENYTSKEEARLSAENKYAPSCGSSMAIHHYLGGQPFYRTEMLQRLHGVPLSDATQWDIINTLHSQCVSHVFTALEEVAAQSREIDFDDTPNRVLSLKAQGKSAHTTALIAKDSEKTIQLYYTGSAIAKENISLLLIKRSVLSILFTMCDASSQNVPQWTKDSLLFTWVFCLCLVHSRRKFYHLQKSFRVECGFVLDVIGQVYRHERHCKDKQLTPQERLSYHQEHSAPLMEALHVWLTSQLQFQLVEENSELGKAILYMLRHWEGLTRFLRVAGAPIDNSLCEQSIKMVIRLRRNSLFYKTHHGARVGDAMMSVIQTALKNNVNAFDYLNVLQENAAAVAATPHLFLPWNYQDTVRTLAHAQAA